MNVEQNSIYNTRYIRILGYTSMSLSVVMLLTAIIIHATPKYVDIYNSESPLQGTVWELMIEWNEISCFALEKWKSS